MAKVFGDFDMTDFWEDSPYAREEYVDDPPDEASVQAVEKQLGFKLPASYVEFMKVQNGGQPRRKNHRTWKQPSGSGDYISITGMFSIGSTKPNSLCGPYGQELWVEEWGYPPIGVYFADCPSAGHDMVCLDYSECGPRGEPRVVHIDQEDDYEVTVLAENFEAFVRGLEDDSVFDGEE